MKVLALIPDRGADQDEDSNRELRGDRSSNGLRFAVGHGLRHELLR